MIWTVVGLAAITAWAILAWLKLRPRWRNWRDIRAATKRLDIRNGWIVEHGRDRRIAVVHCGNCRNRIRLIDSSAHAATSIPYLISVATEHRCTHKE